MSQQLPIISVMHNNIRVRPIAFWVFFNFFAVCACSGEKDEPYQFMALFVSMSIITLLILLVTFIFILQKKQLCIDEECLSFSNFFGKTTQRYLLKELTDFRWGSGALTVSHIRYMGQTRLKTESIELHFNGEEPFAIDFDAYGNFDEIKKYLFSYAVKNGIITLEPLEKRKRR